MRPIWSRTSSFGLVSVPVRTLPATEPKELRFHFLHRKEGEVVDLTAALRESVERTKKQRKGTSKRKAS
jgi:non-homologous end joining protein Ku